MRSSMNEGPLVPNVYRFRRTDGRISRGKRDRIELALGVEKNKIKDRGWNRGGDQKTKWHLVGKEFQLEAPASFRQRDGNCLTLTCS